MHPIGKHSKTIAHQQFVTGETYLMEPLKMRSKANHAHFFAVLHTAWENLPESLYEQHPTPEALRNWAAIVAGHYDVKTVPCDTEKEAASFMLRAIKGFPDAHIEQTGHVVIIKTAKSLSFSSMAEREFQDLKRDILEVLSMLVGTDITKLSKKFIYAA
jgi:hypothetical protein